MPRSLLVLFACLLTSVSLAVAAEDEEGFRPLFNGKDLTGWVVVNTAPSTWSFNEDGYLVCSGKPIGEIRTEKMYQNFILELEWRHLKPKGNAGIFVWADDITARGQPFHRGVEVQVLENAYGNTKGYTTHGDIFPIHGATMTPINGRGGKRAFPTENRSNPSPEWNHYRIECRDGNISLAVNGKVVTRGKDCSPRKGYLCVESEGGIVHYRNVRIKELPDTPIEPEHIAIASRGYRCLYTGVDFEGWKTAKGWVSKDWMMHSQAEAEPLVSEAKIPADFGFVFDVRLKEDSGIPRVDIGGVTLEIDPKAPGLADLLEPTGKWNRFEGTLRDRQLSVEVNGKPWHEDLPLALAERDRPWTFTPDGPTDWANPFLRELPETEAQASALPAPRGHLILHGGGSLTKDVTRKFLELGGGKNGHLVIVPTSGAEEPDTDSEATPGWARQLGFGKITVLHTRDPEEADTEAFVEPLKTATAIWFSGGRQWRTMDAYLGTRTAEAFHEVYRRGGVIAGSSAGATVQGSYLVRGAPEGNHIMMAKGHEEGFGFLPGTAVDQHAIARDRLEDMVPVLERHPQLLGVSIDEGTAIHVHDGVATVLGKSQVAFYDAKTWETRQKDEPHYRLLAPGERYDLGTREPVP